MAVKGKMIGFLLVLLLATTAGCRVLQGGQRRDVAFELNTPFTVGNGQSALLQQDDLQIKFDSVVRDGRCPSEVNCAEHGAVEILVVVQRGEGEPASYEMNPDPVMVDIGWAPTMVTFEDYGIELQAVEPYPERPEDLEAFDDYEATFVVSEAAGE